MIGWLEPAPPLMRHMLANRESGTDARPHIVLLGGGHSNALALLILAKHHHRRRYRITLVSDSRHTPYSGMLPGYIAGVYRRSECLVDLQATAAAHRADFICERAIGLDDACVHLQNGDRLAYDILSINTGATPQLPFAAPTGQAVKPISDFMDWLDTMSESVRAGSCNSCVVIGGGAGGVESILALAKRFADLSVAKPPTLTLITPALLPNFPPATRRHLQRALAQRQIRTITARATGYQDGTITTDCGRRVHSGYLLWTAGVQPPAWLDNTHLQRSPRGFISVSPTLQTTAAAHIFATGDIADHAADTDFAYPKSGAIAVRQAPVLAHNLIAAARGTRLKAWRGRHNPLAILGTADGRAVAAYKNRTLHGRWVWHWKHHLDQKFIHRFPT